MRLRCVWKWFPTGPPLPGTPPPYSEKVFVSQERVSGFPEKGADLRGSPELPGKFGELPGKFGELPGNLWIAGRFHSERISGEVAEKLPGKSGDFPRSSGQPDSFPATRQICLQLAITLWHENITYEAISYAAPIALRLLNALNSEDRGLKVRFSLAMIVFETFELILCQMLSSQGKNAPSNPYPHYLVRLATSRWGLFLSWNSCVHGFWGEISLTISKVLSDRKVLLKHKNGVNNR